MYCGLEMYSNSTGQPCFSFSHKFLASLYCQPFSYQECCILILLSGQVSIFQSENLNFSLISLVFSELRMLPDTRKLKNIPFQDCKSEQLTHGLYMRQYIVGCTMITTNQFTFAYARVFKINYCNIYYTVLCHILYMKNFCSPFSCIS